MEIIPAEELNSMVEEKRGRNELDYREEIIHVEISLLHCLPIIGFHMYYVISFVESWKLSSSML